jgi:hypothetical protein
MEGRCASQVEGTKDPSGAGTGLCVWAASLADRQSSAQMPVIFSHMFYVAIFNPEVRGNFRGWRALFSAGCARACTSASINRTAMTMTSSLSLLFIIEAFAINYSSNHFLQGLMAAAAQAKK